MNNANFEPNIKTVRNADSIESIQRTRKHHKTQRGLGLKGAFRNAKGDSVLNQEKYFVGA